MKTPLFLADVKGLTEEEIKEGIVISYETSAKNVNKYDIIIAYQSVGDYGCDSSSFFLLRNKKTKKLYENHGSHCSCYGFEGQWKPELTTIEYLHSDKFGLSCGGYDDEETENKKLVKKFIKTLTK